MSTSRHALTAATALAALALLGMPGPAEAQSSDAAPQVSATLGSGQARMTHYSVLDSLPRMTRQEALAHPKIRRPAAGIGEQQYQARKARAATAPFTTKGASEPPAPAPARPIGLETPGARKNFNGGDETCSNLTPADMGIAAARNVVLQLVNSCIYIFNGNGVLSVGYPKSFNAFLGLPASADTFDPRALYDAVANRFITTIDQFDVANNQGFVWVSVSATSDPRGAWFHYRMQFGSQGSAPDFPTLGQDRHGIYIGANVFGAANGNFTSFQQNQVDLLPKAAMYRGAGFNFRFFTNLNVGGVNVDSTQPANTADTMDNPRAEFMVSSKNINFGGGQCSGSPCNGLVVWALSNQFDTTTFFPELSGVSIGTAHNYMLPPAARQKGGPNNIDTGDTRISGEVTYSHGTLYAALNTKDDGGFASTLWFQIQPVLNDNDPRCTGAFTNACPQITTATILNEECFACGGQGTNGSNYYGVVQPDLEGNATMVYAFSDDNNNPGVAYASRRATQAANSFHDVGNFLADGQHSYSQGRWGDYNGVALLQGIQQPIETTPQVIWFSGMYALSNGNWGTRIGDNGFANVRQP